jgi:hypothetical protein
LVWQETPELPPVLVPLEVDPLELPPEEAELPALDDEPETEPEVDPLTLPELFEGRDVEPLADPVEPLPLELPPTELPATTVSSTGRISERPQATATQPAVTARAHPVLATMRIAQGPLSLMQMPRSGSLTMYEQNWLFGHGPPCWGSQIALQVPPKLTAPP